MITYVSTKLSLSYKALSVSRAQKHASKQAVSWKMRVPSNLFLTDLRIGEGDVNKRDESLLVADLIRKQSKGDKLATSNKRL